jgi:23S rRNA (adenine2503-C2)-methyltransferase
LNSLGADLRNNKKDPPSGGFFVGRPGKQYSLKIFSFDDKISDMDLKRINEICKEKYRLKQIKKFVYFDFGDDWSEATILPKETRSILSQNCDLRISGEHIESSDGKSLKAIIKFDAGGAVETVLMKQSGRNTICVSSQIGCPVGCVFCATGEMGFERNLTAEEILEQIVYFGRLLKKTDEKITNIVFMGMGEPFLNFANVMEAIRTLNDKDAFNLGARRISISTVGVPGGIAQLAEEKLDVNLAISLHAPNDDLRNYLIPMNKNYSLKKIFTEVDRYIQQKNRKVMFEYVLIDGVNDSEEVAKSLALLMRKPLYHLNLIPYNPTGKFKSSTRKNILHFKSILESSGVSFSERFRFGRGVNAACGQLAINKKLKK